MPAIGTQGTIFQVMDPNASPGVYVTVGEVTGLRDLRSGQGAEIDTTHLLSTAKSFMLGLKDEGTMSVDMMFDPNDNGQSILEDLRDAREIGHFRVSVPTVPATAYIFDGLVTQFPFTVAPDEVYRSTVTIRVTGDILPEES